MISSFSQTAQIRAKKSDGVIFYDVIFLEMFLFAIIAVIGKGKFLHKFKQCTTVYNLFNFVELRCCK